MKNDSYVSLGLSCELDDDFDAFSAAFFALSLNHCGALCSAPPPGAKQVSLEWPRLLQLVQLSLPFDGVVDVRFELMTHTQICILSTKESV